MLFLNEKIICEVPIYSMPEKEFKRRWNNWKKKWYDKSEQLGYTPERTEETVKMIMETKYPRNVWKYNQIVGFVEIAIGSRDISFNVQKTLDSRIQAVGKTKHYIQDMMTNGMHFSIDNMMNEELVVKIDEYLDDIQKNLQKPFCLYRETYNSVKDYIDYRGIQKEIQLDKSNKCSYN